jgi:hypothetical protein
MEENRDSQTRSLSKYLLYLLLVIYYVVCLLRAFLKVKMMKETKNIFDSVSSLFPVFVHIELSRAYRFVKAFACSKFGA